MTGNDTTYEGREFEAAANLRNYYTWITNMFGDAIRGDGAEIGAGEGNYSEYLRPHLKTLDVVEPSTKQAEKLAEKFADDPNVCAHNLIIHRYYDLKGASSLDTICLVNVLEHIEDDLGALQTFHKLLRPGGHVCIFVPALPFLFSKLDEMFGHHRRYLRSELASKAKSAGFDVKACKYMDLAGVPAWGLINTIGGSTSLNPRMMAIYDSAVVPITRAVESVLPIPFGKSLALVAVKS